MQNVSHSTFIFGGADGFRYANIRYLAAYEQARRALRCECAPVSALYQRFTVVYHQFREKLHIIHSKSGISSLRKDTTYGWWYTRFGEIYSSKRMIYTPRRDDMPLLSQWIKKTMENVSFSIVFLVEPTDFAYGEYICTRLRWASSPRLRLICAPVFARELRCVQRAIVFFYAERGVVRSASGFNRGSSKWKRTPRWASSFILVEPTGIEPVSKDPFTQLSP